MSPCSEERSKNQIAAALADFNESLFRRRCSRRQTVRAKDATLSPALGIGTYTK
jgi:hypothetical protein